MCIESKYISNVFLYLRSLRKEGYTQAEIHYLFQSLVIPNLTYGLPSTVLLVQSLPGGVLSYIGYTHRAGCLGRFVLKKGIHFRPILVWNWVWLLLFHCFLNFIIIVIISIILSIISSLDRLLIALYVLSFAQRIRIFSAQTCITYIHKSLFHLEFKKSQNRLVSYYYYHHHHYHYYHNFVQRVSRKQPLPKLQMVFRICFSFCKICKGK